MSYRDILMPIDDSKGFAARAATAATLARRLDSRLTGAFLKSDFLRNYMAGEAMVYTATDILDRLIKDHTAGVAKACEAARATFESAAGEAGVESDWLTLDGDDAYPLAAAARRFDLTVMPVSLTASLGWRTITAAEIGLASGGPVLLLPDQTSGAPVGERVLIAWKGTRESARALRDAWPMIEAARAVRVLVVAPEGEGGPEGMLQRLLERHGCKADLVIDRSEDDSAGDILRRQVADFGADLLVMGLYGKPRLQELVLGGVSRDMLRAPPAALLLSH
ncbi:MAG: universal stress protein [Caulobacter sp.]|nr:universal stress protein [Caulobacter sp.]